MRRIPWWALLSASAAPVLLIGGWTLAAALQPPGYSSVRDTISALAGLGATDRWVMTVALAGLGVCHLVTALGLRPAATAGRLILATGGVATVLVAAFPLSAAGTSEPHRWAAGVALLALGIWPALPSPRDGRETPAPWALRRATGITISIVLMGLLGWFVAQLADGGPLVGLTERLVAGGQALWPMVVVATVRFGPLR